MIYKVRKEIDPNHLNLRWLIENPHPGTTQFVEERLEEIRMEDIYRMLKYPNFIHLIMTRLRILNSPYLSKNSEAIHLLMKNPELIDWYMLSANPSSKALEIIEENIINEQNQINTATTVFQKLQIQCERVYSEYPAFWRLLATNTNPKAIEIIEKYYSKLTPFCIDSECIDFWCDLSRNSNAVHLLEKYPRYIDWRSILKNPKAVHLIEQNLDKIDEDDWPLLSGNPGAVHIFENPEYLDKIDDWSYLSQNPEPKAIQILEKNLDKVVWESFSKNPSAISILLQILKEEKEVKKKRENNESVNKQDYKYYDYFDKIDFSRLSLNPAIFELDTQGLKERCDVYRKELIEKAMHPHRMIALLDQEGIDLEDLEDYF